MASGQRDDEPLVTPEKTYIIESALPGRAARTE